MTGKWDPKSWLKNDTHAAEGLATTDKGSTVQTSTPEPQPITSSEAEKSGYCNRFGQWILDPNLAIDTRPKLGSWY